MLDLLFLFRMDYYWIVCMHQEMLWSGLNHFFCWLMARKTYEHRVVFVSHNQCKYPSYEHVVQMQTQETGSQWIINPVLPSGHALGHISITVTPHGDVLLLQPNFTAPYGFRWNEGVGSSTRLFLLKTTRRWIDYGVNLKGESWGKGLV